MNKTKIGIITFHRARNYGAVLQAYALKETLRILGANVNVIDYMSDKIINDYKIKNDKTIKGIIKYVLQTKYIFKTQEKFDEFVLNYLNLSEKYTKENLKKANDYYDKFITGSDQVWNMVYAQKDKSYFLDFVRDKSKKNSYAASLGGQDISSKLKDLYSNLLSDFNKISVREVQVKKLIENISGKNVEVNVDPTFLLSSNQWSKLAGENRLINKKYILVYDFDITLAIMNAAKELSDKTGYPVYRISDSFKQFSIMKNIKGVGPIEFLNLFKNAEYIITNSFHGTAFSINFEKKFYVQGLQNKSFLNARIYNILDKLDLRYRELNNSNIDLDEIDYVKVKELLGKERDKSYGYLKQIIESEI